MLVARLGRDSDARELRGSRKADGRKPGRGRRSRTPPVETTVSADSRSPPPGPRRSATLETLRAGIRDTHLNRTDERPSSGALHQHDHQRRPQRWPELVPRLTDAGVAHEVLSGV